jgi:N-acyl-D-amino-acid deacylase
MHTFKGEIIAGRYHGLLEAVEVAREAEIRLLIAHFTPAYIIPQPQPRLLQEAAARASLMEIIDKPRQEGVDVYFNVIASTPSIGRPQFILDIFFRPDLALPDWLAKLSRGAFVERLRDKAFRDQVKTFFYSGRFKIWMIHPVVNPYWMDCFRVLRCKNQDVVGKTIGDLARERSPRRVFNAVYHASVEVVFDLLIEDPEVTWGFVHDIRENPGALPIFLKHPAGMPCSDTFSLPAAGRGDDLSQVPPIAYNLFPHYLRTFVKEQRVLSLEEAVMKTTYLPAQAVLGLSDRGLLAVGAYADIVIFDPDRIGETNDFMEPARPPAGIEHVIVNGKAVYRNKQHTGARPGKVLRKAH